MEDRFDAIIIGMGPGGELISGKLLKAGKKVAVIEKELIGGECAYWACIPSKTLIRPPEARGEAERAFGTGTPTLDLKEIFEYRDSMIRNLDDSAQVESYEEKGATVVKGEGRLNGPGRVEVNGETFEADHIVVATGSAASVLPIEGLEDVPVWTNREVTTTHEVPERAVVIGGGPNGIESAQTLSRFGSRVTLVEYEDRLISREDEAVGELIQDILEEEGLDVRVGRSVEKARKNGGDTILELDDGTEIETDVVVVVAGRTPRIEGIGLESVGVDTSGKGLPVDDRCRLGEGLWAVGDVTGIMPLTHVAQYQARIVVANILGDGSAQADYRGIPRVVFSDPEVAATGLTEEQAREQGMDVCATVLDLTKALARSWTYEQNPRGTLGLVVDREQRLLIGAWAVAPLAGEWIHQAALAIRARIPVDTLLGTVAQFPTFSGAYLEALERLDL